MALTTDQEKEYDRYIAFVFTQEGAMTPLTWFKQTEVEHLAGFRAWTSNERIREARQEEDVDMRVDNDKIARAERDIILIEIDRLTQL